MADTVFGALVPALFVGLLAYAITANGLDYSEDTALVVGFIIGIPTWVLTYWKIS